MEVLLFFYEDTVQTCSVNGRHEQDRSESCRNRASRAFISRGSTLNFIDWSDPLEQAISLFLYECDLESVLDCENVVLWDHNGERRGRVMVQTSAQHNLNTRIQKTTVSVLKQKALRVS